MEAMEAWPPSDRSQRPNLTGPLRRRVEPDRIDIAPMGDRLGLATRTTHTQGMTPGSAIADPRVLACLGVLLLNDRWAKAVFGNTVTGKVSDIVGPVVAVVVLSTVASRVARAVGRRPPGPRAIAAAFGIWFTAIQISTTSAALMVSALDAVLPWDNAIVPDPFDLVGLLALPMAVRIIERPASWPRVGRHSDDVKNHIRREASSEGPDTVYAPTESGARRRPLQRTVEHGVLVFAGLICVASSGPHYPQVRVVESGDEVIIEELGFTAGEPPEERLRLDRQAREWVQISETDEGAELGHACSSTAPRCLRVEGGRVDERSDDGTWTTVWDVALDDISSRRSGYDHGFEGWADPLVDSSGTVVIPISPGPPDGVSPGPVDDGWVLVGWPDGSWSPSERAMRPIPNTMWVIGALGIVAVAAAWSVGSRRSVGKQEHPSVGGRDDHHGSAGARTADDRPTPLRTWALGISAAAIASGLGLSFTGTVSVQGLQWLLLAPVITVAFAVGLAALVAAFPQVRQLFPVPHRGVAIAVVAVLTVAAVSILGLPDTLAVGVLVVAAIAVVTIPAAGVLVVRRARALGDLWLLGAAILVMVVPVVPLLAWQRTGTPRFDVAVGCSAITLVAVVGLVGWVSARRSGNRA